MKNKILMGLAGLACYLLFLLAQAPVGRILPWVTLPPGVMLSGVSGTLWHGYVEQVRWQNVVLGKIEWRLPLTSVLLADPVLELTLKDRQTLSGQLELGWQGGPRVRDVALHSDAEWLLGQSPLPLPVGASGPLQLTLAEATKLHQHPGADVETQDGAAEHHALDPLGAKLRQVADEDGAKRDADKMGVGDAQVIQQAQDILGHGPKAVVPLYHLLQLVGLAVTAKVQQQHVEVLPVGPQLLEPDGGAAARTVHEHHPIPIGTQFKGLVVQHLMGSRGDGGYTRRAY